MRKMWLVYDWHGQCQGWFGSEEMAQAVAELIGGTVQITYI